MKNILILGAMLLLSIGPISAQDKQAEKIQFVDTLTVDQCLWGLITEDVTREKVFETGSISMRVDGEKYMVLHNLEHGTIVIYHAGNPQIFDDTKEGFSEALKYLKELIFSE